MSERRTAADGDEGSARTDLVERYAVSDDATEAEFLAAAKLYAREVVDCHDLSVDVRGLDWAVSKRAKRRAGVVTHTAGEPEALRLTWEHFEANGWAAAAGTVRHELVHVHLLNEADDPSHGEAFQRLAATLDAPVHCERFADPNWWVICTDCDARIARYRRSKLVTEPGAYRCADCGGPFRVESTD